MGQVGGGWLAKYIFLTSVSAQTYQGEPAKQQIYKVINTFNRKQERPGPRVSAAPNRKKVPQGVNSREKASVEPPSTLRDEFW